MDVIIVVARTATQEHFWQKRLKARRGILCSEQTNIIVIHEERDLDFPHFSFLSAYAKAQEKAKYMYRLDLFEMQKKGASIALYQDQGSARRLFPIGASEGGDPFLIKLPGDRDSLLENVIAHTQRIQGEKRGRLFIFRTDLLVVPLYTVEASVAHIEWHSLPQHPVSPIFSINLSAQATFALMRQLGSFSQLREKFVLLHSDRNFSEEKTELGNSYIWDYGSAKSYHQTMLKLSSLDKEGVAMRLFYGISPYPESCLNSCVIIDETSRLMNCNIASGSVKNSVLIDVTADRLDVENCVIIGSKFHSLKTEFSLLYHVEETQVCKLSTGTIRADCPLKGSDKKTALYSDRGINIEKYWSYRLPQNPASFAQIWDELKSF